MVETARTATTDVRHDTTLCCIIPLLLSTETFSATYELLELGFQCLGNSPERPASGMPNAF